jgi:hypothetical protein
MGGVTAAPFIMKTLEKQIRTYQGYYTLGVYYYLKIDTYFINRPIWANATIIVEV